MDVLSKSVCSLRSRVAEADSKQQPLVVRRSDTLGVVLEKNNETTKDDKLASKSSSKSPPANYDKEKADHILTSSPPVFSEENESFVKIGSVFSLKQQEKQQHLQGHRAADLSKSVQMPDVQLSCTNMGGEPVKLSEVPLLSCSKQPINEASVKVRTEGLNLTQPQFVAGKEIYKIHRDILSLKLLP